MKTIDSYLTKKINTMRGNVIAIGCSDKMLDAISKNDGIRNCYELNNVSRISGKYEKKGSMKKVNIKKFKRKFKHKKTNVMIVNVLDVVDFAKRFVGSSVYITNEVVYLYTDKEDEKTTLMLEKYKRYHTTLEEVKLKDGIVYKIDCSNTKQSRIRDFGYLIKDTVDNFIDILGDYLIN